MAHQRVFENPWRYQSLAGKDTLESGGGPMAKHDLVTSIKILMYPIEWPFTREKWG